MEIRRLSKMSMEDMIKLWNDAFQNYFVDVTMSMEQMLMRITAESIRPELSFALYVEENPVGILLNGIRKINGRNTAWNGGIAVIPELRHQGVGRQLLQEALRLYEQEGIEVAFLEAIAANSVAISLYEKMGYSIIDRIDSFKQTGKLEAAAFDMDGQQRITIKHTIPQETGSLPFYDNNVPWQSQYCNISSGEALIATNEEGQAIGYVIYKRHFGLDGQHRATSLHQCRTDKNLPGSKEVIATLLKHALIPEAELDRRVVNLSSSQTELVSLLELAGFQRQVQSVHMKKQLV